MSENIIFLTSKSKALTSVEDFKQAVLDGFEEIEVGQLDFSEKDWRTLLSDARHALLDHDQIAIMPITRRNTNAFIPFYELVDIDFAMGKKKITEMEKHRGIFIEGAKKNNVKPKVAEELFDQMIKFAEYCFNKSHSMAYTYVTYQTAYLKANYPVEYMAALLS